MLRMDDINNDEQRNNVRDDEMQVEANAKNKIYAISAKDGKFAINIPPEENEDRNKEETEIAYKINDVPSWYLCVILGLQHYLTMFGGTITYPYLMAPHMCISEEDPARGYMITTTLFVSGICTFLQATFGCRLPIVQGSSFAFLVPMLAILKLPEWQCPDLSNENITISIEERNEIWMSRMREVQGAIIGASLFEVAIGFTGIMGFVLTWITPLAIVPTISLVGLSLFAEAAKSAAGHWGIAAFTIFLLVLFSQCLRNVDAYYPKYNSTNGWKCSQFPLFKLFPVLLTILFSWALCAVLTVTNVFSEGNPGRTDLRLTVLADSPWFRVPYPGQWGLPTFSAGAIFGVVAGSIASAVESVGDYYACARLSQAPSLPKHAINRGIWIEGIGCIIAGLFGTGGGVTSYSENIGAIGITKVASRRVIQYGSALMILFGMFGKFGALFVTIPEPIIGGVFCVMFSMITAVGLSTLHFVDLNSSRNLFVLGFSIFMGLCLPKWLQSNPGVINTGNVAFDQIVLILLSTNMLVGGFFGVLLDNLIPGTYEERGVLKWKKNDSSNATSTENSNCYDVPFFGAICRRISFFKYLPISPTYEEELMSTQFRHLKKCLKRNRKQAAESSHF